MTESEEIEYFEKLKKSAEAVLAGNAVEVPKDIQTSEQLVEWLKRKPETK